MIVARPTGQGASARKYDLLTAMGALALASAPGEQKRILRLMTLITARYNWQNDRLTIGQREIARLWSCDERTVKRDFARLKAKGWLTVHRQGARGHVGEYGLDIARILIASQTCWGKIGPDFQARLTGQDQVPEPASNIVALPGRGDVAPPEGTGDTEWDIARLRFHAMDPGRYGAWIHALKRMGRAGGHLTLKAPSRFHASYVATHLATTLLAILQDVDETVSSVEILSQ